MKPSKICFFDRTTGQTLDKVSSEQEQAIKDRVWAGLLNVRPSPKIIITFRPS